MFEQLSLWDSQPVIPSPLPSSLNLRNIGDKIGRVILGECRIATITEIEGLPNYPFYRTDAGIVYSYKDGMKDIDVLLLEAEQTRSMYDTVIPHDLEERLTVTYPPRESDGKVLWAQLGIFNGMLYWKESMTYQFLEKYENERTLRKNYQDHKKNILSDLAGKAFIMAHEHPMRRLYASKCANGYADAEYVLYNP